MIILGSHALGTTVMVPATKCDTCKRMTVVLVHNPLAPGALCSCCAGAK